MKVDVLTQTYPFIISFLSFLVLFLNVILCEDAHNMTCCCHHKSLNDNVEMGLVKTNL